MTKKTPAKKRKPSARKPAKKTTAKRRPRKQSTPRRSWLKRWLWRLLLLSLLVGVLGTLWLDHVVRERFESHEWVLPARVLSSPESLYVGRQLQAEHLVKLLDLMRYRRVKRVASPGSYHRLGNHFEIYTRGFDDTAGGEPPMHLALTIASGEITHLTNASGQPLAIARLEPLLIGSIHPGTHEVRVYVPLEEIPPLLVELLLATEDRDFYQHIGISFRGIARALYVDITTGSLSQGGSTLTQQLVKNLWLSNRRTLLRKLIEVPMALLMELHYSKQQILEAYLNEAYAGQDGGRAIHGMGLAAQFYYGRPLKELTPPQLAMLVGLLRGPSWYNPRQNPERARERRNEVLHNAVETGGMSKQDYRRYSRQPLTVVSKGSSALYAFPAFTDLVRRQLARDYSADDLSRGGLQIHSTLDVLYQFQAEEALSSFLKRKDSSGELNGAVVVVAPNQGDVLALVGDRKPRRAGFNRALDAKRPIGSLVKPFVVLTALSNPNYTLATLVADEPLKVPLGGGRVWTPENYDHQSRGPIPLLEALVDSRNQAIAQVGMKLGLRAVVDMLHRLGLRKDITPYPSILLGGFNLTPLQVAMLYQPIANGGFQTPLRSITDVLNQQGEPLARYPAASNQVLPADLAYLVQWAMQQVVAEGTGRYANSRLPQLQLAGKTGTTNDWRDSWFAGFSGSTLAVVWIGRDDNGSTGLTGNTGALRVWTQLMANTPQQPLRLNPPANIDMVWLAENGKALSGAGCEGSKQYPLTQSKIPEKSDGCGSIERATEGVVEWFQKLFGG